MSGRRQKALRRAFRAKHGRAPERDVTQRGVIRGFDWSTAARRHRLLDDAFTPGSEWRRLKKYGAAA